MLWFQPLPQIAPMTWSLLSLVPLGLLTGLLSGLLGIGGGLVFSPLLLLVDPALQGWLVPHTDLESFARNTGTLWLAVGVGGLLFRTVHLFFIKDVMSGLVWMTKILTDPFHDIKLYYKAPLALMRGELIEPRDLAQMEEEHGMRHA
jgi:hypothetical protein